MQAKPRRLGLLGGECTGKSSLAEALRTELPACVVGEAVRDFVARTGRPPRVDEQPAVAAEQAARVAAAWSTCPHPWVVADPAPLMTAVYSVLYFGDDTLLPGALEDAAAYDLLAWCAPDLPWHPDAGVRDGPGHRQAADRILRDIVSDVLRPRGVTVLRLAGPLQARVRSVTGAAASGRAWQRGGPSAAT